MIKISNFTKSYGKTAPAVQNLNLEIKKGEVFGFLGPNGAGKSTTIKTIVGMLNPSQGEITINGIDVTKDPVKSKMQIGYVPDEPVLMEKLKGIEYLNFIADIFNVESNIRKKRIEKLSESFKLVSALANPVDTYSHGMRQKLVLIAALLHNPEVWILDEPIVGLDPESAYILKKMMKAHVKNGKTVFFSTHVMEIVEKICDRVGIISKGKLVFCGTIEELKVNRQNQSMEEVFLEVTDSEAEQNDFSYLDSD
jgi:ABC-2 type transport system ATP-binding protein